MHCNFTVGEVLVHGNEFFFADSRYIFTFSNLLWDTFQCTSWSAFDFMRTSNYRAYSFFRDKSVNDHVDISTKKEQQTKWVSYLTPKANEEVKITMWGSQVTRNITSCIGNVLRLFSRVLNNLVCFIFKEKYCRLGSWLV